MDDHALKNAQAKLAGIVALVDALSVDFDNVHTYRAGVFEMDDDETAAARADIEKLIAAECDDATSDDDIRERIYEMPLSVEVRSNWRSISESAPIGADEYRILLTWGGPACQLVGDLGEYGQPENVHIQYQDWGIPWTDYNASADETAAMLEFVSCFYFGE